MEENYEQLELDVTLDGERDLKENVRRTTDFALEQIRYYEKPTEVRNQHEGYGIAAEQFLALEGDTKATKKVLEDILKMLPNGKGDFIQLCGSLYANASKAAVSAIRLAAHAQRILTDLYDSVTPIEEAINEAENDGFEDADISDDEEAENENQGDDPESED